MFTKYKIRRRWPEAKIEEVNVVRETESCVFLPTSPTKRNPKGENKELKNTEWHEFHNTWEAAHAALTDKAAHQVADARRRLESANAFAESVKGMRHSVEVTGDSD